MRRRFATVSSDLAAGTDASFGPVDAYTWPFFLMAGVMLFQFIGFQYSAYISGEVRGNVTRGILLAVLGALVLAVLMNSIYAEMLPRRLGLDLLVERAHLLLRYRRETAFGGVAARHR